MTKEQLQSILEHSSISKEYLEALARAVDACEEPDTLKKEFLVAALMEVEVDRVVPWLKILPERAVEGVDFSEVDRETSEDAVVPEADPDPGQQNSTTESADRASEAKKTHIIALREALDKSSKVNRSLGLSFVALMFYILLIIASTTDLMLFLPDEKVNLPIVDVELPLKGFYAVTPFLVLIFHFNLLINLYHHRKRFIALREAEGQTPDYDQLHPFLFNYLDRYPKRFGLRLLLRSLILISLFFFPFLNVLLMQYRFAAYHDFQISMLQMAASILSGMLMLAFYRMIVDTPGNGEDSTDNQRESTDGFWGRFFERRRVLSSVNAAWFSTIAGFLFAVFMGGVAIYLHLSKTSDRVTPSEYAWLIPSIDLTYYVDEVNQVDEGLVMKYVNDSTEVDEAKEMAIRNHGKGYKLMNRDFRYAVMPGINLCNTDAEGADFRFADLNRSKFSNSNMVGVRFEGSDLRRVQMQRANLEGVNLSEVDGRDLILTHFEEANLDYAQLQNLNFRGARMKGAYFNDAQLENVNLSAAHLQGVSFSDAKLQGAKLVFAQLQGVDFSFAQLQGADLSYAQLQASYLIQAHLQGANLAGAQLQGANLALAQLQGANLAGAHLQGAFLDSCNVFLSNLNNLSCTLVSLGGIKNIGFAVTDSLRPDFDYDSLISRAASIPEYSSGAYFPYPRADYLENIEKVKLLVESNEIFELPEGIYAGERIRMLYKVGCQDRYSVKGILNQFRLEESNLSIISDSLQKHCPDKLARGKKEYSYLF